MEAVFYQAKDTFIPKLTKIMEEMHDDVNKNIYRDNESLINSGYGERISKLIKGRFNLDIEVNGVLSDIAPLAIIPFSSDLLNQLATTLPDTNSRSKLADKFRLEGRNGIDQMSPGFTQAQIDRILKEIDTVLSNNKAKAKAINNKTGGVDREKAIVFGYMAEVRHQLILNANFIFKVGELNAYEFAEAITHEIGHAFTGLEYHYKQITTNAAISEIATELNNNNTKKALYVFKSMFGVDELLAAGLNESSTATDFYGAMVMAKGMKLSSQYQSSMNDATTFEYLSDNFVVKLGGGAHLSTGLDKLNTKFSGGANKMKNWMLYDYLSDTFNTLIWTLIFIGTPVIVTTYLIVTGFIRAKTPDIYDNYKDRHTRILNEISNILKDKSLPKSERELLIQRYDLIKSIADSNYNQESYNVWLFKVMLPSLRRDSRFKKRQQEIEALMNNSMFQASTKLDLL